jgi:transcriptional regulator NrdR family protein
MELNIIKNRLGDIVEFDKSKIKNALQKAYEACGKSDTNTIDEITENVVKNLQNCTTSDIITIENIQDIVENCLMEN